MDGYLYLNKALKVVAAISSLSGSRSLGRFGDKQWTKRWIGNEIADIGYRDAKDFLFKHYITQCDGKVYAATLCTGSLMVIEENRPKNLELKSLYSRLPRSSSSSIRHCQYLLDFCEQLCAVEISWGGVNHQDVIDIQISKLEIRGYRMKWVKSKNSLYLAMSDFRFVRLPAKSKHTEAKVEDIVIEDNDEARAIELYDIPSYILELIAEKLDGADYVNFRYVCNIFRSTDSQINWSGASLKLSSPSLGPWLVFSEAVIELPQKAGGHRFCFGYGFSSSPSSIDNILVGIKSFTTIHYLCRREGEWKEYMFSNYDFEPSYNSPIYFDGAFYFIDRKGKLGVFRWNDGKVSWNVLNNLESPCHRFRYNYLVECKGKLLSVYVDDRFVHFYKLIFRKAMAWRKVTTLNNYTLFVSRSSCFSVIPNFSYMENRVYFSNFFRKDIVYYCARQGKFYTSENKEAALDFKKTKQILSGSWIEPIQKL
ncbi:hypothetical protein DITRI_Ditri01bG0178700 [Diplodiscus trichospermus]